MQNIREIFYLFTLALGLLSYALSTHADDANRFQPYSQNPVYPNDSYILKTIFPYCKGLRE